ncbi:MAG TPA: GspH/FimT family pseudopilin [Longimicrobiaceae bacterium]|nr:GspH/FimT family pseudopilin [Longimicrobiaceae bacterium]
MTSPTSARRLSTAGFTLIELVAVMILLGIGAAMAAPRMNRMAMGNKTEGAASRLSSDLAYARILAARWGRPTSLRFSSTGSEYTVTVDTAGSTSPNYVEVKTVWISRDYAGVHITSPANRVSFSSRGMVSSGHGTFIAQGTNRADTLELYLTGRTYRAD